MFFKPQKNEKMRIVTQERFYYLSMQENLILENVHFKDCNFHHCNLSDCISSEREASLMKNCIFEDCTINENCNVGNGILENIKFYNFKTTESLAFSGALFNKVSFYGKCGSFSLSSYTSQRGGNAGKILTEEQINNFNNAANIYYQDVEWALDISNAEFRNLEILDNVPVDLVKVNCYSQVIVRKAHINMDKLEQNPYILASHKQMIINSKRDCILVVATIDNKYEKQELESLKVLKGEGLAQCE